MIKYARGPYSLADLDRGVHFEGGPNLLGHRKSRLPPDSGAPLLYRFVLQTVVLRVFCLGYVSDWTNFTITKIEAEYYGFIMLRNGIYNSEGVESLRLCLSTQARFATFIQNQLKIYRNYCYWTNILRKFEEMKQLQIIVNKSVLRFK